MCARPIDGKWLNARCGKESNASMTDDIPTTTSLLPSLPKKGKVPRVPGKRAPTPSRPALTFADGMKYTIARIGSLIENEDPVRLLQMLIEVRAAESGAHPPNLIPVTWQSKKQPWTEEFDRLCESYGKRDVATPETANVLKQQGRPTIEDQEWTP